MTKQRSDADIHRGGPPVRVVNVGLIGYGTGGATFHMPFIRAVPHLAVRAVMTSRAGDVARDLPHARVVADAADIIADPAIELVVIASPNTTHFDLANAALRSGKHVVIDKPIATRTADADALIATANAYGRLLSVYQIRRWDGDFLTVKRCIDEGRLGTVYAYEAHFDRFRPAIKPGWRETPAPGSGVLFDLGSHLIDQALLLFGLPDTVTADVLTQRPQAHVDDYFSVTLGYGTRRAMVRASTLAALPGPHFAVHGDGGSFVKYGMDPQEAALKAGGSPDAPHWGVDEPAAYGTFAGADGSRERVPTIPGAYVRFYAEMAAAIVDGSPVPVPASQARDTIAIIECAIRSSAERRTVAVLR